MQNLKDFLNTVFVFISAQNFSKIEKYLGEKGSKKSPKRGHFMDAESIQKTLNIFNLTITYAILIKLSTNMYLNKVFPLAKFWGITYRV